MARGSLNQINYCWCKITGITQSDTMSYIELVESKALTELEFENLIKTEKEFKEKEHYVIFKDKTKHLKQNLKDITGELFKIKIGKKQFENKPEFDTIKFYLRDKKENEYYTLSCNYDAITMPIRQIINHLLTLDDFSNITIGIFTNKDGWANAVIQSHGQKTEGLYTRSEQDAYVKSFEYQGKKLNDRTALDELLLNKVREVIIPRLKNDEEVIDEISDEEAEQIAMEEEMRKEKEESHSEKPSTEEVKFTSEVKDKDLPF